MQLGVHASREPAVQEPARWVGLTAIAEHPHARTVPIAGHVVIARHVVTVPPARFDAFGPFEEFEPAFVAGLRHVEQPQRSRGALCTWIPHPLPLQWERSGAARERAEVRAAAPAPATPPPGGAPRRRPARARPADRDVPASARRAAARSHRTRAGHAGKARPPPPAVRAAARWPGARCARAPASRDGRGARAATRRCAAAALPSAARSAGARA